jgi:hypothetical protein
METQCVFCGFTIETIRYHENTLTEDNKLTKQKERRNKRLPRLW